MSVIEPKEELSDFDKKKFEQITRGVLKGALDAEGFNDIEKCIEDGSTIL